MKLFDLVRSIQPKWLIIVPVILAAYVTAKGDASKSRPTTNAEPTIVQMQANRELSTTEGQTSIEVDRVLKIVPEGHIFNIIDQETDPSGLEVYLRSEDFFVVRHAVARLSNINTDDARKILRALWEKAEPYNVGQFERILTNSVSATKLAHSILKIEPTSISARNYLWSQADSEITVVRLDVARAIGEIGEERFVPIMSKLGSDSDSDVAFTAISALERRGMKGGDASNLLLVLENIIKDSPHKEVIQYAENLISKIRGH